MSTIKIIENMEILYKNYINQIKRRNFYRSLYTIYYVENKFKQNYCEREFYY